MKHTPECEAWQQKWSEERIIFEMTYPAFCRRCGGSGFVGGGYDRDTGYCDPDPCPACHELGLCPLCKGVLTEESVCKKCGWGTPGMAMAFLPDQPECSCYEKLFEDAIESSRNMQDWLELDLRNQDQEDING
jgi:hypothetical protein